MTALIAAVGRTLAYIIATILGLAFLGAQLWITIRLILWITGGLS